MSSRLYKFLIAAVDKRVPQIARPFWEYEAGPKTIFFWAPMCKWGLVLASIKDLARPAELLSVEQILAIGATGFVYSRFSMVIVPKNYTLLSVNVFVAITQTIQLYRALNYKHQQGTLFPAGEKPNRKRIEVS